MNNRKRLIKETFLKELRSLRTGGNVTIACKITGTPRKSIYRYRKGDPIFANKWNNAIIESKEGFADLAEHCLKKAAIEKLNVTAIIFALRSLRPEKWQ